MGVLRVESNKLLLGNCSKVMQGFDSDSVDLVVTDPPYGYSFMGKDWDKAVPKVAVWRECLRVLKPGAFMFVMSSPRADVLSQMIVRIGEAGFRTDFTPIYWAYASGFPKAMNIGKMVDKRNGRQPEQYKELGKYLRKARGDRPQKEIAELFPSKTGGLTGCVANWELGLNVPTKEQWIVLKKKLHLDSCFDSLIEREEAKREIIGKDGRTAKDSMFNIGVQSEWDITIPATEKAKLLDGSYAGFQPKPAVEIIIVAMKPLSEKTFVDQALTNGKGVTWLDKCKIPTSEILNGGAYAEDKNKVGGIYGKLDYKCGEFHQPEGRFPANLLVSDDCLNDGNITISNGGSGDATKNSLDRTDIGYGYKRTETASGLGGYGDSGSFSRYFDLDTWFSKTVNDLPENVKATFPFLIVPKASKSERNKGCEDLPSTEMRYLEGGKIPIDTEGKERERYTTQTRNFHPTVKPLKLMCYLITLGSRTGDLVLDPFAGSGTTCLAAKMLGRRFLGIEIKREYLQIAEVRVGNHKTITEFLVASSFDAKGMSEASQC